MAKGEDVENVNKNWRELFTLAKYIKDENDKMKEIELQPYSYNFPLSCYSQ